MVRFYKKIYKRQRYKFLKYLIYISVTFTILFYSPLFWYLGDKLVIRDEPVKSEAIVIFSGNGEASYKNPSYQKEHLMVSSIIKMVMQIKYF